MYPGVIRQNFRLIKWRLHLIRLQYNSTRLEKSCAIYIAGPSRQPVYTVYIKNRGLGDCRGEAKPNAGQTVGNPFILAIITSAGSPGDTDTYWH